MNELRVFIAALAAATLAACASSPTPKGATFERIGDEVKQAAASLARPAANPVGDALLPPLQVEPPKASAEASEPRFDLAVSAAPASQVFMAIVSGTRYSMLVPPDIVGTISVSLKNVTVREALEAIRDLYGYGFKFTGNRILVQSNSMQTQVFRVNYLAGRRLGGSDVRVNSSTLTQGVSSSSGQSSSGSLTTTTSTGAYNPAQPAGAGSTGAGADSSRVSTFTEADFWRDLQAALVAIVGTAEGRGVIINRLPGVIVVRALPSELRMVEQYLKATQLIIERQVMLEAKIIEVALNDEYQSGINWSSFNRRDSRLSLGSASPGAQLSPGGALDASGALVLPGVGGGLVASGVGKGFYGLAFQTANFAALLNFLESQGNVQVLSSPRIATLNNQKAVLKVGTDDLFITGLSTTTSTTGTTSTSSPNLTLQPFFSGISLDVTPQVGEDNQIILHVHPAISVVTEKTKVVDLGSDLGTFRLPLASSTINETDSVVRVLDGHIVAIGGLMTQEQSSGRSGLPGVSAASGAGALFGQRDSVFRKREIVVLLKPTVIKGQDNWRPDLEGLSQRLDDFNPVTHPVYQ